MYQTRCRVRFSISVGVFRNFFTTIRKTVDKLKKLPPYVARTNYTRFPLRKVLGLCVSRSNPFDRNRVDAETKTHVITSSFRTHNPRRTKNREKLPTDAKCTLSVYYNVVRELTEIQRNIRLSIPKTVPWCFRVQIIVMSCFSSYIHIICILYTCCSSYTRCDGIQAMDRTFVLYYQVRVIYL